MSDEVITEIKTLRPTDLGIYADAKDSLQKGYTLEQIKSKWIIPQETEIELLT